MKTIMSIFWVSDIEVQIHTHKKFCSKFLIWWKETNLITWAFLNLLTFKWHGYLGIFHNLHFWKWAAAFKSPESSSSAIYHVDMNLPKSEYWNNRQLFHIVPIYLHHKSMYLVINWHRNSSFRSQVSILFPLYFSVWSSILFTHKKMEMGNNWLVFHLYS